LRGPRASATDGQHRAFLEPNPKIEKIIKKGNVERCSMCMRIF
jgi:hypothetical protein